MSTIWFSRVLPVRRSVTEFIQRQFLPGDGWKVLRGYNALPAPTAGSAFSKIRVVTTSECGS